MKNTHILFGDIGGTNARIAYGFFDANNHLIIQHMHVYRSALYHSFQDILTLFLSTYQITKSQISSICFAIAGPIKNGETKFTNLSWQLSETQIKQHLSCANVWLLNDFAAIGYGIHTLQPSDLFTFNKNQEETGTKLKSIIGAGTGLGMAHISYSNGQPIIHASEGGHVDFAPVGKRQMQLLTYLNSKLHRVSIERVLSGYGIVNIYDFLRQHIYTNPSDYKALDALIKSNKKNAAQYIYEHTDQLDIARSCINLFMEIYAQTISNLALSTLPFGGLYIAGGIAPKISQHFQNAAFKKRLFDKGRMSNLIKDIPMHIILDTKTGLKGAGYYAHLNNHHKKTPAKNISDEVSIV